MMSVEGLLRISYANQSRKAFKLKKTGRIQLAREIIARVKKEMQETRLTESGHNGMRGNSASEPAEPSIHLEKA